MNAYFLLQQYIHFFHFLFFLCNVSSCSLIIIIIILSSRRKGEPPVVPGHIIWGNGEQFKNDAIKFLHDSQKNHGDIFTIRFFHQRLTIIADPHSVEAMSRERCFDFDPIQKQVNMNVFSFVLVNARKMIKEAGKRVRGSHLVSEMRRYAIHLDEAFNKVLQGNNKMNGCEKKDDDNNNNNSDKSNTVINNNNNDTKSYCQKTDGLRKFVSKTNFAAMFYTIFGRSDDQVFEPQTVYHCFDIFHRYFNYLWLGLPIKLFPKAIEALNVLCKQPSSKKILAREDLSDYIRYSTEFMLAHGQSEQDIMGHNLVYLHVNYNTFRLSFWNMYFLLSNREAYDALYNEISAMIRQKMESRASDETGPVVFSIKEIESMPILGK